MPCNFSLNAMQFPLSHHHCYCNKPLSFQNHLKTSTSPNSSKHRTILLRATTPNTSTQSKSSLAQLAPLEAVLFDIDGTLCDSDPVHFNAFRQMLAEMGFNNGVPISEDFFIEKISGKHNVDIGPMLFPDWDPERTMKWMDDKEAMFRRLADEQLTAVDGLPELCKWVEDRGLKRATVTNAPRPNVELMLPKLGLEDFFQHLVIGNESRRAKPFPDPYLDALKELNVSPDHTFVFEDSVSGTKAGVAAGMRVVGLTTSNPRQSLMNAGATFVINNYEDPKLWEALEELEKKNT